MQHKLTRRSAFGLLGGVAAAAGSVAFGWRAIFAEAAGSAPEGPRNLGVPRDDDKAYTNRLPATPSQARRRRSRFPERWIACSAPRSLSVRESGSRA